jgi:Fur family ferric uptake transcriptional regulator
MIRDKFPRNTKQRQVILEELQKMRSHPTASKLYVVVRRRLPKISLGTVYRNLELLSRMGIINKFEHSRGEARYDGTVEHHDHLRCVCCGRLDDLSGPPLPLPSKGREDRGGYKITGHRLEFLGICPQCRRVRRKLKKSSVSRKRCDYSSNH